MAAEPAPFRDAEAWLAARGITREPILEEAPAPPAEPGSEPDPATAAPVSPRDATRLAAQVAADAAVAGAEQQASPVVTFGLEDEVAGAVAFLRRSTAGAPQSEGRLADKLRQRGHPAVVIEHALAQARRERVVDDAAMAAALVEEKRRAGHAPARIRRDLLARGFDAELLDPLLLAAESEDQEAAAFATAVEKAARLTAVPTDTAFRRVVGHLSRRGYPEGLARKVARQAVFTSRDAERAAGR